MRGPARLASGPHVSRGTVAWLAVEIEPALAHSPCERRYHRTQKVHPLEDGACRVTFDAAGLPELAAWVASFGGHVRAVAPPELVQMVRDLDAHGCEVHSTTTEHVFSDDNGEGWGSRVLRRIVPALRIREGRSSRFAVPCRWGMASKDREERRRADAVGTATSQQGRDRLADAEAPDERQRRAATRRLKDHFGSDQPTPLRPQLAMYHGYMRLVEEAHERGVDGTVFDSKGHDDR